MREPVRHEHTNRRGEPLRILAWPAEGATTAMLVHHGLGEHIGRYQTFADRLPEVCIVGYDCRGHGELTARPGHAAGLTELASDLDEMIPVLCGLAGVERFVLVGHSMGAATVLTHLERHARPKGLLGAVLAASPVAVELDLAQRIKVKLGRLLARVAPSATLASGLDKQGISSLPAEVARYQSDPLVHDRISLELARSLVDEAPHLVEPAARVDLPVLLLHGGADPIALPRGSALLHERLPNSRHLELPGARHEAHHEGPETTERYFSTLGGFFEELDPG